MRNQSSAESIAAKSAWAQDLDSISEEELIALRIKLFDLPPRLDKHQISRVAGITITDYYNLQDPKSAVFDASFPPPLGGRRSERAPRHHCTIAILLWDIRRKPMIGR